MSFSIKRVVSKQGHSLRITIPQPIADALEIRKGDVVDIGVQDGKMVVWKKYCNKTEMKKHE